ncbi:aldehyde ferredoxin oxidoreductase family protein [Myxococcota bacterium]
MMNGLTGTILEVDLTAGSIVKGSIPEKLWKDYIGGAGVAARLFFENVDPGVDPLSPDNPLYIITGPLAGSNIPGTSRFAVCAKSPLTGIWGDSTCGGNFAPELKAAGYDAIIIKGASKKPVSLVINDADVRLEDASSLWGKCTYDTVDALKLGTGNLEPGTKPPKVVCIGQGGENLVKYAAVCNDKHDFAGRCGMGAVMGSKKLKAITCRGTGKINIADQPALDTLRKKIYAQISESVPAQSLKEMGTDATMDLGMMTGDVPIKNFRVGEALEISAEIGGPAMTEKHLVKPFACTSCPIASKRVMKVEEGPYQTGPTPGPEYETCASFGSMCLMDDGAALIEMNTWCNRYGLDTITAGSTIAFIMDCYDQGIINRDDLDGIELTWGNAEAILQLLHKIGKREGVGDLLAEGSREAAKRIGKGAADLTAEVKGLEIPMHDPRGWHGLGLAYMTSNRGACHNAHLVHPIEQGMKTWMDLGFSDNYDGQTDAGKGELVKKAEDFGVPCNSIPLCVFDMWTMESHDPIDALNAVAGWTLTLDDYLMIGARTWLLKRSLINMMGITSKDDRLPKKVLEPLPDGGAANSTPDHERLRNDYYAARGLDEKGYPTRETLAQAGLSDVAQKLHG